MTSKDQEQFPESISGESERRQLAGHFTLDLPLAKNAKNESANRRKSFLERLTRDLQKPRFLLEIAALIVVAAYTYQAWQANQLMRRAQRPYIWLTNGGLGSPSFVPERNNSGLGQVVWDWHYTNYGRSPAYHVAYRQFIKLGAQPFQISYGEKQHDIAPPIPPNKDDFSTVISAPITPEEFNRLMTSTSDQGIAIRLSITYTDDAGMPHETDIRLNHLNSGAISYSEAQMK